MQNNQNNRRPNPNAARKNTAAKPVRGSSGNRPQPAPLKKRRISKLRYRWFRASLMVIAAVAGSIFLAIFILQSASDLLGLNQPDHEYTIIIPPNTDIAGATKILSETGVIDKELTFKLYASYKFKEGDSVKPGTYMFNSKNGYDQIILALKNGNEEDSVVKLTFTEGDTLLEIANVLQEKGVCNANEFIDYLQTAELDFDFINEIPANAHRYRRLEGYLFPDTYEFYTPEKVSSVANKFLENFEKRITGDMKKRMDELNWTLDQTITLASIIQKEAGTGTYMRLVSSVFHNRLNNPGNFPKLQSDVTVLYVESDIKPYIGIPNQALFDAYNTFACNGLPVAPVSNPGIEAIKSALYPAETSDYYFLTDKSMDFYFARTLADHEQNKIKAKAADDAKAADTKEPTVES